MVKLAAHFLVFNDHLETRFIVRYLFFKLNGLVMLSCHGLAKLARYLAAILATSSSCSAENQKQKLTDMKISSGQIALHVLIILCLPVDTDEAFSSYLKLNSASDSRSTRSSVWCEYHFHPPPPPSQHRLTSLVIFICHHSKPINRCLDECNPAC